MAPTSIMSWLKTAGAGGIGSVLPHLISVQDVSPCGPFIPQKIQLSVSLPFPGKIGRTFPLLCFKVSAAFLYDGFI